MGSSEKRYSIPGWVYLFITGIILVTLTMSGVAIYVRYGSFGLSLAGMLVAIWLVGALVEGLGTALLKRLLDRIWPGQSRQPHEAHSGSGE
jgi:hypothetical protein